MSIGRREFLGAAALWPTAGGAAASAASVRERMREGLPLKELDLVDAHGHFGPAPADAMWPYSLENLLEDQDRCGIRMAVVSHFGAIGATSEEDFGAANAESAAAVRAHRGRLRAYQVFHPRLLDASLAAMKETARPGSPFAGFKLHAELHRYAPDGPAYQQLYAFAHERAAPVLLHIGPNPKEWIATLHQIAGRYPRMPLIVAHLGGGEDLALAILSARRPNLYIDTCVSTSVHRLIERLVRAAGPERILFGTDATYLCPAAQLAKVVSADLSGADKKALLAGNARRIFGHALPE
jgi:hypothetical protein